MLLSRRNILKKGRQAKPALVAASEAGVKDGQRGNFRISAAVQAVVVSFPGAIREQLEAEYLEGYQEGSRSEELPFP